MSARASSTNTQSSSMTVVPKLKLSIYGIHILKQFQSCVKKTLSTEDGQVISLKELYKKNKNGMYFSFLTGIYPHL